MSATNVGEGAIVTRAEDASLLSRLMSVLPAALVRLQEDESWRGFLVGEAQGPMRIRLLCRDRLVDRTTGRVYSLAAHRFDDVGAETAFHDHRYPLAVFPFGDLGTAADDVLYEMPWQRRALADRSTIGGVLVVRDSEPWAILDHQNVWHAVHSKRVHFSVLLSDVTEPPTRPDRLVSRALSVADTHEAQRMVARALAAACRRLSSKTRTSG